MTFEPVARRTISEEVRDQLLGAIGRGAYAPGDPLPSERSLCDELQVARTSVREAIQALVSLGVVERRGNRTVVVEHLPEIDLTGRDLRKERVRELFEVRRLLEIPLAEFASCRATDDERERLRILAEGFNDDLPLQEFRALDRLFHSTLARAGHNALLTELHGKVLDALFDSDSTDALLTAEPNEAEVREVIARSGEAHRAIAKAVVAGEQIAVAEVVSAHLDDVERTLIDRLQ
ncbi:MAG: GntR family transcriptional regulator [Actinomycetota bacterium]